MAVARYSALLLVLGLLVVGSLASLDARIIANLASFQSPSGGFVGSNDEVTLQATNQALFLASLYGTRNQLNLAPIPGFIRTCENADGGFGQSASAASDVASTRNALLSLTYLDQEINAAQVSKFLASRFESSGLASNANGQPASLEATAQALQSFDLLNDRKNAAIPTSALVSLLNGASKGDHFEFAGVSLAAGNYYGIVIASIVDYDFDDIAAWAAFIGRQQAGNGGFYENGAGSATTLEATAQSVSAMKILSKIAQQRFTNSLAFPSLKTFITRTADTLNDAALAHLVVALTNFDDVVKVSVSYEPSNPSLPVKDSRAIVGSQIKPSIAVKAFNTIVHSGLDVEVAYTLPGDSPKSQRLVASTSGAYTADDFVESQQFGQVTFKFSANQYVETVGRMEFEISDTVSFGYGIEVVSNAVHGATGKEVAERESVPLGTDFTFQVALFTSTETQKTSGDFDVIFSLRDASGIVLYQKVEDARSRSDDAFTFTYTLDTPALPTGYLSFQFDVRGSDNVVHTSDTVLFVYSSTMLATEIDFEDSDGEFTLGSTATVYMTPAVLPDLKNVNALPSTDFFGTDVYEQRQFLLDLTTLSGTSVGSFRGVHAQGGRYKFSVPLSHSLDSLGTSVLAFRFLTSSSHTVALSAYDSVAEEVLDDPHAVNITVTAQLQASGIADQAVPSSLSYGNQVSLTFQLQDVNTGRAVSKGERGNVFLLLNHVDAEHEAAFTSSKQAAVERDGEFTVTWNVDPNAIRGAGYLTVVAENADGAQVPISGTDGKPLRYDVTIDGNIDIAFTSTSTDNPFLSAAAFLAQVKLSSNGRPLQGAKLSVEVVPSSGETFSALVANGADGVYTVSWIASHTKAYSGTYTLRFFREADRVQAAEIDAANEKKYRKERRERELRGQEVGEEEVLPKTPVTPLFEKTLSHSQVVHRPWPIRIDFVVFFGFAYALWSIWTKSSSTTQ